MKEHSNFITNSFINFEDITKEKRDRVTNNVRFAQNLSSFILLSLTLIEINMSRVFVRISRDRLFLVDFVIYSTLWYMWPQNEYTWDI